MTAERTVPAPGRCGKAVRDVGRVAAGVLMAATLLLAGAPASAQPEGATGAEASEPDSAPQPSDEPEGDDEAVKAPSETPPAEPSDEPDEMMPELTLTAGVFSITFDGYVRTGLIAVLTGDETPDFIGENNGFAMFDARLATIVNYADVVMAKLQIDGAVDVRGDVDDPVGTETVRLKDAYGQLIAWPWIQVAIGQRKPPLDVESEQSTNELFFIRRSIVSEGVQSGEAIEREGTEGLGVDRQLGFHVLSEIIELGPVGVFYHAAVTNGNDAIGTRNDNNDFAIYGRIEFHLLNRLLGLEEDGSWLTLGGSVAYNQRTVGDLLNQLGTDDLTYGADLQVDVAGFAFLGQFLMRERSFPDIGQPEQETLGFVAQAGYWFPWPDLEFMLGYRFAYLDPFVDDDSSLFAANDLLMYHTAAVGYRVTNMPIQLQVNYTATIEEDDAAIDNDIVELLASFAW